MGVCPFPRRSHPLLMTLAQTVSVIIPTHNYGRFLKDALGSVFAQGWPEMTVIVVDDASEDDTPQVVQAYGNKLQYVRHENRGGTAKARNTGLNMVKEGVVCFLDSDDVWLPGGLQALMKTLASSPDADGACARMVNVPHDAMAWAGQHPSELTGKAVQGWQAGSVAFRRTCFERVGGFDETLPNAEFVEWISRARHVGLNFATTEELVVLRRVHGSNSVLTKPTLAPGYLQMIQQHLQRKRAAGSTVAKD